MHRVTWAYQTLLRPLLFTTPPEWAHTQALNVGRFSARNPRLLRYYQNLAVPPDQSVCLLGKRVQTPVGVGGGFDKDAEITPSLGSLGFGMVEVGSVTQKPYAGNPGVHLTRAKRQKGIVVNYGLKSAGAAVVYPRVAAAYLLPRPYLLGVNLAPSNDGSCTTSQQAARELAAGIGQFDAVCDYITLNLSCPNTACPQPFQDPLELPLLLRELPAISTPILVKLSPDLPQGVVSNLLHLLEREPRIHGVIWSNLTKLHKPAELSPTPGGLSGPLVLPHMLERLSWSRKQFGDRFTLIGCGGVQCQSDYEATRSAGADAVQVVTGLIYTGPLIVRELLGGTPKPHEVKKQDGH